VEVFVILNTSATELFIEPENGSDIELGEEIFNQLLPLQTLSELSGP